MAKDKGFILLRRSLQDHWIWNDPEPFDHRSAWVDLLLMANHETKKVGFYGNYREIHRGQILTSIDKLQIRWHWSEGKVKRFLHNLKSDSMVLTDSSTRGTLITLINYDKMQSWKTTDGATDKPTDDATDRLTDDATDGPADEPQTKNVKECKNIKRKKREPAAPYSSERHWE